MKALVVVCVGAFAIGACGKGDKGTSAASGPPAESIWQLAGEDARFVLVAEPEALSRLATALDAVRAGTNDMPPLNMLPDAIATPEGRAIAKIDLSRPAGLIATGAGTVVFPPATDPVAVAKSLPGGWTCKTVRGWVACAGRKAAFGKLSAGDGRASVDADWPAALPGNVRVLADVPGTPMRAAIAVEPGAFELRAIVESVGGMVPPAARKVPSALATEVAARQPSGFARARVPLAWIAGQSPLPPLPGGLELDALLKASTGEIVVAAYGEPSMRGESLIGVTDVAVAGTAVEQLCAALPAFIPGVEAKPGTATCAGTLPPGVLEAASGARRDEALPFAMSVRPDAIAIAVGDEGDAPAVSPMTELGRELLTGDWLVAFWGQGSMLTRGDTSTWEPLAGLPMAAAVAWPMLRVQSLALAGGVRGDDVHVHLRLETIYTNPPALVAQIEPLLDRVAAGEAAAVDELFALADAHPNTWFGRALRAGPAGLMPPVAGFGMLSAVLVPAFVKYQQRSGQ